jgi:hypothetical protein
VSPVKYEQGLYIPEDDILHRHRREKLKTYKTTGEPVLGLTVQTNILEHYTVL